MKSAERREECTYTKHEGEEGSPDSPRWAVASPDARTHARIVFRVRLQLVVHCAQVSSSSCCHLAYLPSFPCSLALPSKRTWRSGDGRAAVHRIRWVDAYESPEAARKRVRFSCMLAESRRPNPHKSVVLAVQERPFLAALMHAG